MKNYNKLVKVIQEANPEIMELKMGCLVEYEIYTGCMCGQCINTTEIRKLTIIKFKDESHFGYEKEFIKERGYERSYYETVEGKDIRKSLFKKILGRPIRLADVLLAINSGALIDRCGIFYDVISLKPLNIGRAWILGKDLDNQSDETKQFLIDLLVLKICHQKK